MGTRLAVIQRRGDVWLAVFWSGREPVAFEDGAWPDVHRALRCVGLALGVAPTSVEHGGIRRGRSRKGAVSEKQPRRRHGKRFGQRY